MAKYTYEDLNNGKVQSALTSHEDFVIKDIPDLGKAVNKLEKLIEGNNMSCRIYTAGRSASILAGVVSPITGIASAVGIAAHRLATINPDYEIAKHPLDGKLNLVYKG